MHAKSNKMKASLSFSHSTALCPCAAGNEPGPTTGPPRVKSHQHLHTLFPFS
jgi:hypothetical protein